MKLNIILKNVSIKKTVSDKIQQTVFKYYIHFNLNSVNVELSASAGIHSDKPRPDVKIVTRLHSESHIEAQFKIQDSHLGLVKVSVPSENVAYTKIRSV